jgi:hypothetical protein
MILTAANAHGHFRGCRQFPGTTEQLTPLRQDSVVRLAHKTAALQRFIRKQGQADFGRSQISGRRDMPIGRTLSPGERVSQAVTGVGFAAAALGAARVAAAGAAKFETLTVEQMKDICGGSPVAKPPVMSPADLNKPVPQIREGMGPKLMLSTSERTGVLRILNVLERLRLNPGDESALRGPRGAQGETDGVRKISD